MYIVIFPEEHLRMPKKGKKASARQRKRKGDAEALYKRGESYCFGKGVPQDKKEAMRCYTLAAEQGHAKAQCILGECYRGGNGVAEDMKEAVRWYKLAAKQNLAVAKEHLDTLVPCICAACGIHTLSYITLRTLF